MICCVRIPVERTVVGRNHHAFYVEVVVEAFRSEFPADPAFTHTTPRGGGVESMVVVDPDYAGFNRRCHTMSAGQVACPDRST